MGRRKGLELTGIGSWTLRSAPKQRGVEPDECYSIGPVGDRPDLAIEVAWTRGGLEKLEIYRGLGVRELWTWREATIEVRVLRGDAYHQTDESEILPGLDLALIGRLAIHASQPAAVRELRSILRGQ